MTLLDPDMADNAYSDRERRRRPRARGMQAAARYKRHCGQAGPHTAQERFNRAVSRVRARVARSIAMFKQQMGYRRERYRGRKRNAFDFVLTVAAANIKSSLSRGGTSPRTENPGGYGGGPGRSPTDDAGPAARGRGEGARPARRSVQTARPDAARKTVTVPIM